MSLHKKRKSECDSINEKEESLKDEDPCEKKGKTEPKPQLQQQQQQELKKTEEGIEEKKKELEQKKESIEKKELVKEIKETKEEKVTETKGDKAVREILQLFEEVGSSDYIGEPVTQIEHSCQAAEFAKRAGYPEAVRLASLFHDIGHLIGAKRKLPQMGDLGVMNHELVGADYLRSLGFPETICILVQKHVDAKRYLTFVKPEYYSKLSDASKKTLEYQGGRMDSVEADDFEQNPLKQIILLMRTWDEKAKEIDLKVPDVKSFSEMIKRIVDGPREVSVSIETSLSD